MAEEFTPAMPPRRRRRTFMIISFVILGLLVLCGGVATTAILVTNREAGTGQDSPTSAVQGFLTAIYLDRDATKAADFVCADARKSGGLSDKVDEIRADDVRYKTSSYRWDAPIVVARTASRATVNVTVRVTTTDERAASENLVLTTVRDHGWWVCEVTTGK